MKIIQCRKEWRNDTVMQLMKHNGLSVSNAIKEARELEKFVFQNEFIVEIDNLEQKIALEGLIKSMK